MGWIRIALSAGRRLGPQGTPDGQIDSHQYGRRRRESVSLWDSFTVSLPVFNITKSSNSSRSLLSLRLFLRVRLTLVFTERHHDAPHSFTSSVRPSVRRPSPREREKRRRRTNAAGGVRGAQGGAEGLTQFYMNMVTGEVPEPPLCWLHCCRRAPRLGSVAVLFSSYCLLKSCQRFDKQHAHINVPHSER